ncbi:MAG: hypothetical protein ACRDBG_27325 [Waterburya sp.]
MKLINSVGLDIQISRPLGINFEGSPTIQPKKGLVVINPPANIGALSRTSNVYRKIYEQVGESMIPKYYPMSKYESGTAFEYGEMREHFPMEAVIRYGHEATTVQTLDIGQILSIRKHIAEKGIVGPVVHERISGQKYTATVVKVSSKKTLILGVDAVIEQQVEKIVEKVDFGLDYFNLQLIAYDGRIMITDVNAYYSDEYKDAVLNLCQNRGRW